MTNIENYISRFAPQRETSSAFAEESIVWNNRAYYQWME